MNIGARLEAVAQLVPAGCTLADIGTDHAYLPVWLMQKGLIKSAVAADIAAGPCRAAETNIGLYGLRSKIQVRMGSGLTVLQPGEVDGAVIAGMGGSTIVQILEESPNVAKALQFLIVQPMAGAAGLRQWVCANGWRIAAEKLAEEPQHLYEIILLERGTEPPHTALEYEVGPCLLAERPPLFTKHILKLHGTYERMLKSMQQSSKAQQSEKYQKLVQLAAGLEALKHECGC